MRLTVGPLPAAVYWRRRAIVLGVLVLVGYLIVRCSSDSSGAPDKTGQPAGDVAASPTSTLQRPIVPSEGATPSTSAQPQPRPTGPCTDDEIALRVSTEGNRTEYAVGTSVKIFLHIKNTSARSCSRDLGGRAQEVRITQGAQKIWSSDDCSAPGGSDEQTLAAGQELQISNLAWDGRVSTVCQNRPLVKPGTYQLLGRVNTKWSEPVTLTITG
jgi:hypothetical protein